MPGMEKCEYCGRPIKGEAEVVVRRGKEHVYCSDFCFKLHFYDAPTITYEDLQKMYELRCISVKFD
ncbi:MAG: hypothetical protein GX263_00560 [Firmicutes bacterium]|jgi:ribosome-binding protein aMBF1 (putative translation factor)|nr:hypothetical protein [Bacillota bacterium]